MSETVIHNTPAGVLEVPVGLESGFPELIKLIANTESMDIGEKRYWVSLLPKMDDSQIDRLFDILDTERRKLEELEAKYHEEIKNLNEKHLVELQEFQAAQPRKDVFTASSPEDDDVLRLLENLSQEEYDLEIAGTP